MTTVNNSNSNLTSNVNNKMNNILNKMHTNNNIFTIRKNRTNSEQKEITEKTQTKKLHNLLSVPRYNVPKNKIFEEKKNIINNNSIKRKRNLNSDKRIYETYKLYLSKDMRKILSKNKKYQLPKIIINKNSPNSIIK